MSLTDEQIAQMQARLAHLEDALHGQLRLKGFAKLVGEMRAAQKRYFKSRSSQDLRDSRSLEIHVDADVQEILEEGKTLFNQG